MIDVRIPVLVYLTCFSLCVVSILGLAAEKKKQEAKDNPEAKAKAKQKKKKERLQRQLTLKVFLKSCRMNKMHKMAKQSMELRPNMAGLVDYMF